MADRRKYPHNWKKVSRIIRRIAGYRCEWCHALEGAPNPLGFPVKLSVHHLGAPYANGRPGNPHDKHDLRRENLVALCEGCHLLADWPLQRENKITSRAKARRALVPYQPLASGAI